METTVTLNILNDHEMEIVKSILKYCNEVAQRDPNGTTNIDLVLKQERDELVRRLGEKVLWIVEEYALLQEEQQNKYHVAMGASYGLKPGWKPLKSDVGFSV